MEESPWKELRDYADDTVFVNEPEDMLKERLVARKIRGGSSDREAEDILILTELTIDNTAVKYSNIWHRREEMPEGWLGELLQTTDESIYLLDHSTTAGNCLWYTVNGTNGRDYLIMENNGRYYLWKIYTGPLG